MMNEVNRCFAALAKIHAAIYLIVGGLCTSSTYVLLLDTKTSIEWLRPIGYVGLIGMMAYFIFSKFFYEQYEFGRKDLPITNSGMVLKDEYFYIKINSEITQLKKLIGYLYVIFRVFTNCFFGFTLFAILILGVMKGLGL